MVSQSRRAKTCPAEKTKFGQNQVFIFFGYFPDFQWGFFFRLLYEYESQQVDTTTGGGMKSGG